MMSGKTVWLSDNVLEWLDKHSKEDESPNACFERVLEGIEIEDKMDSAWTEDEIKQIAKNAAEEKFFELKRQM